MTPGPERLDHFMSRANAAYYARRDPFADFTTAPEICQAFGEVLGLWAAVTWDILGRPDPVILAEAGPGRGTLMRDALRAISRAAPAFGAALRLHLIETSPRLRSQQSALFPQAEWHETVDSLPAGPLILLGNEFLDALPIRQFIRRGLGWTERHVSAAGFVELPSSDDAPSPAWAGEPRSQPSEGTIVEVNEAALALAGELGTRLAAHPGAALFLDYGPAESSFGSSLQAIREGRFCPPLVEPGSADLTAHVDFAAFAKAARQAGAAVHGPLPQGVFLTRLGLLQRTDRIARTQGPGKALALIQSARRLIEPDQMGRLFKAIALASPGRAVPPGFENA